MSHIEVMRNGVFSPINAHIVSLRGLCTWLNVHSPAWLADLDPEIEITSRKTDVEHFENYIIYNSATKEPGKSSLR